MPGSVARKRARVSVESDMRKVAAFAAAIGHLLPSPTPRDATATCEANEEPMSAIEVPEDDIPVAVKRQLLDQEIALWRNTRYQLALRVRVAKHLGDGDNVIGPLRADLERCEKALDAVHAERDALGGVVP